MWKRESFNVTTVLRCLFNVAFRILPMQIGLTMALLVILSRYIVGLLVFIISHPFKVYRWFLDAYY